MTWDVIHGTGSQEGEVKWGQHESEPERWLPRGGAMVGRERGTGQRPKEGQREWGEPFMGLTNARGMLRHPPRHAQPLAGFPAGASVLGKEALTPAHLAGTPSPWFLLSEAEECGCLLPELSGPGQGGSSPPLWVWGGQHCQPSSIRWAEEAGGASGAQAPAG